MEEYNEMNGQNSEQNTGGGYYQHDTMPKQKKNRQNNCAGYILVGILCLLVGMAVGSCATTLAISGINKAAESLLPGEDKDDGDDDDGGFGFEWHFGETNPESNEPAKEEEYQEPEKKQYTGREMPALDGQTPIISDTTNPAPDIVEQTFESVVGVNSYEKIDDRDELAGYGSGFVISSEGYIVTNAHVIKGASKVTVTLPDSDQEEIDAEVVGYDSTMDIAVLYVRKDGLKPLALGSAENVRVGDFTIAIGNPSGSELAGTATFGIISATSRNVNIDGRENEYLQTDAAINPGNSGGPLLNMKGEVIGITTAKNVFAGYDEYGNTISAEGLGFAIPIDKAMEVVEELITQGHVARPGIGVNVVEITEENAEKYDLHPGILIYSVTKNGPAHKAGLRVDDIVTAYDGISVTTQDDFVNYIKDKRVGDTISLEIIRNGEKMTLEVTLGDINEMGDELVGNRTSSLFD